MQSGFATCFNEFFASLATIATTRYSTLLARQNCKRFRDSGYGFRRRMSGGTGACAVEFDQQRSSRSRGPGEPRRSAAWLSMVEW